MRIAIRDMSHAYARGPMVLRQVNLLIEQSETVAIVAPSGAGKTTLLSILGGLTKPSAGIIEWDRSARLTSMDLASRVGWIFQTVNVLGARSALDNVALGLYGRGAMHAEARERAREVLRVVGLDGLIDRRAESLSGGELQRVAVARALVGSRELVLADEPTAQLDASTTRSIIDAIFRARADTTTLVVATHDPEVAGRCDRRIVIHDGWVAEG